MFRKLLARVFQFRAYAQPDSVGYLGWIDAPLIGCVGFVRQDGSLLFDW